MIENKIYTNFIPKISTLDARKKWIISSIAPKGAIIIDEGAKNALLNGKSLLAAGVTKISGNFKKGEKILVVNEKEENLARGIQTYI